MELIKDALSTVVNRFDYESSITVENFAFAGPAVLKEPDLALITPYFKEFGITMSPQEALDVIMRFDVDPSVLSKNELENRIKLLNIFLKLLDNADISNAILQKYFSTMPNQEVVKENVKNTVNLLKRMVKLLILEAQPTPTCQCNSNNMLKLSLGILVIIVMVQAYMLYNKK